MLLELFVEGFSSAPKEIVLDLDTMDLPLHIMSGKSRSANQDTSAGA